LVIIVGDAREGGITEPAAYHLRGTGDWAIVSDLKMRARMEAHCVVYRKPPGPPAVDVDKI
jgi:hypothetical protein